MACLAMPIGTAHRHPHVAIEQLMSPIAVPTVDINIFIQSRDYEV